ncbi:MAG TPA: maleylpyruvate isomerase family mycothiol-dependent enzyme [Pseudonocardia sp.]|jgi:uncharacterized protein (TIGR03083 family)|nr:maleylpyruvate isomerase family mycothiol-dependent enzyme [Pseudonocardia sp.]
MTSIPRQPLVDALDEQWRNISALMAELPDGDWATPALPGWSVHDVVAHMAGTEAMLLGEQPPEPPDDPSALPHVHNPIAVLNERWVAMVRGWKPGDLLARFDEVTGRRREALAAMSQEDFDAPSWTPAGQATYGRFMQIRVFDCWMHEQDIRAAVGRPGNEDGAPAELAIDEIERALGYIVGKLGGAPKGSTVTFTLTGPAPRVRHVVVADRATVADTIDHPATATITMPSTLFARLAGGRTQAVRHRDAITLGGDTTLGEHITDKLAYTI